MQYEFGFDINRVVDTSSCAADLPVFWDRIHMKMYIFYYSVIEWILLFS